MSLAKDIMLKLHKCDIYKGFMPIYEEDLHGGGFPEIFASLFKEINPKVFFEVGSWKGRSAIQLATLLKKQGMDGVLVCIDTWLGGLEHLPPEISESWSIHKYRKNGYPQLYHQFLSNIVRDDVNDVVVPLPNTSAIGAMWLKKHNIKADLIFVDGSHEYLDVVADISNLYDLLNDGAIICGDDYNSFRGVKRAVNEFVIGNKLNLEIQQDTFWIIRKGEKIGWYANVRRQGSSPKIFLKEVMKEVLLRYGIKMTRSIKNKHSI